MKKTLMVAVMACLAMPALAIETRGGTAADYAEIQAFHDKSIAKSNAGDRQGALDDYLDRVRVLNTKSKVITGKAEMRAGAEKPNPATRGYLVSEIEELEVNGSGVGAWAYMICRYASATLARDTGQPVSEPVNGRYTALLSKTPQGWKVLLDLDNGALGAVPEMTARLKQEIAK